MVQLNGLTWQNPRGYDPLIRTAQLWQEANPDQRIHWHQLPWIDFEHELLASFEGRSANYDLVMLDHPWLGTLTHHGYLRAWNELTDDSYIDNLRDRVVPPSVESYELDSKLWALPVDAACHAGLIREDLIDSTALPTDWSDMYGWCEEHYDPPRRYPLVLSVSSVLGHCLFLAMMESLGKPAYRDATRQTCDQDAARWVLQTLGDLLEFTPPGSTHWGPWDIYERMSTSDVVGYCPQIFGYVNYFHSERPERLKLTACPTVKGMAARPIVGGVGLAVSAKSAYPSQAAAYAQFVMSNPAQLDVFTKFNGQPAAAAAWGDTGVNSSVNNFYNDMLPLMQKSFVRPQYNGFHQIELRNAQVLQGFWDKKIDIEKATNYLTDPLVTPC